MCVVTTEIFWDRKSLMFLKSYQAGPLQERICYGSQEMSWWQMFWKPFSDSGGQCSPPSAQNHSILNDSSEGLPYGCGSPVSHCTQRIHVHCSQDAQSTVLIAHSGLSKTIRDIHNDHVQPVLGIKKTRDPPKGELLPALPLPYFQAFKREMFVM